jgi:hypothetical protein
LKDASSTSSGDISTTIYWEDGEDFTFTMPPPPNITLWDNSNSTITSMRSATASSINDNITASNCSGILRLQSTSVPVVTQIVTISFTVTLTAANQTLTNPPIEYPLPPCFTVFSSVEGPPPSPPGYFITSTKMKSADDFPIAEGGSQMEPFTSTIFVTSKIAVPLTPVPKIPEYGPKSPVVQPDPATSAPPSFRPKDPEDNQDHDQPNDYSSNSNPSDNNNNNDQNGNDQNGNNQDGDNQDGDIENDGNEDGDEQDDDKQSDNSQNGNNQNGNNQNGNNQNGNNQNGNNQNGNNQGGGGVGAIIASILSQPWKPRPAPTQAADKDNPSTSAYLGPINPGAIVTNILRLPKAPAATPLVGQSGQPGQPGQPGQQGQQGQYIPILIGPSDVVIGNQVVHMPSASEQPKVVVVNGESFTVAATEVAGRYTTVPFPLVGGFVRASPSTIVVAGVPVIMVGTSQAIISGQTYSIGPSANPTTIIVNGQTIRIGSAGVGFASTTLMGPAFSSTAVGGVNVGLGASQVVISGSTYNIGPSATPTTIVVNGQTISIGPGGVGFASTTIHGSSPTTTAVGGVTFAIGASQVVISGTTYNIGPSATPTTIVIDGQTISIGPNGLGFASTTISPAAGATSASTTSTATQRTSPSSTLPSRTGPEAQTPTPSSGAAPPSTNNHLSTFSASVVVATIIGLTILL